jgi:hypothetical protein
MYFPNLAGTVFSAPHAGHFISQNGGRPSVSSAALHWAQMVSSAAANGAAGVADEAGVAAGTCSCAADVVFSSAFMTVFICIGAGVLLE